MVYYKELIGQQVEIITCIAKQYLRKQGKIVDETKQTLKVELNGKIVTFFKKRMTLRLIPSGVLVYGNNIGKRPEERVK